MKYILILIALMSCTKKEDIFPVESTKNYASFNLSGPAIGKSVQLSFTLTNGSFTKTWNETIIYKNRTINIDLGRLRIAKYSVYSIVSCPSCSTPSVTKTDEVNIISQDNIIICATNIID